MCVHSQKKLLQPLRAFAFAPLAVHAAVHSPAGHLLLTETHVYAAAARYVHTAVAAGFTAGWYIEHKLALTPGHGESAASHPSPDGGRTHGEDAPREVVRARDTSIGHLTGAARLSSGSVHAPTPKSLGMSDTVTLTGGSPKPPSAVTVHSDTVRHHGYAEPMSIHSARGAQAPNRGGSGEEATAWAAGRTRDAAVHGQPTQGASPRSGGQLEDVGAPGAGVPSRGRRADEWSRAAAGRGRTGTPRAAAHGRLPRGRDGQTAPPLACGGAQAMPQSPGNAGCRRGRRKRSHGRRDEAARGGCGGYTRGHGLTHTIKRRPAPHMRLNAHIRRKIVHQNRPRPGRWPAQPRRDG